MRIYTCCPEAGCGAHAETLNFLKSWGVEPALGVDAEEGRHNLDFDVPKGRKRRPFVRALLRKTEGGVLCYCGFWHSPDAEGNVLRVRCTSCHLMFNVCMKCASEGSLRGYSRAQ